MKVSEQVARLEVECSDLRNIANTIIATCRVNVARGTLKCDDPEAFDGLLSQWALQVVAAGAKGETLP